MSSINNSNKLPSANNVTLGKLVETDTKSIKSSSNSSSTTAVDSLATKQSPANIALPVSDGRTPAPTAPNSPVMKPVQATTTTVAPRLPVSDDKSAVSSSKLDSVKNFGNKVLGGLKAGMSAIGAGFSYLYNKSAVAMTFVGAKIAAGYGIVKSFIKNLLTAKPKTEEQKAQIAAKKAKKAYLVKLEKDLNAKVDAELAAKKAAKQAAKNKKA